LDLIAAHSHHREVAVVGEWTIGRQAASARYAVGFAAFGPTTLSASLRRAVCDVGGDPSRVGVRRTGVVVLLRVMSTAQPGLEVERLRDELARRLDHAALSAAFAPVDDGSATGDLALLQVEQTLVLRASEGRGRTLTLDELGPYRLIVGRPIDEIRAFCEDTLAPLVPPRSARDVDLLDTLEAYLGCDRSPLHVGRQLYLHRNTVHDRIRRIRALLGGRLDDAEARLGLQLALLGWRVVSKLDPRPPEPMKPRRKRRTMHAMPTIVRA
jgi:DNA-binding PucR family transcriptional regulator